MDGTTRWLFHRYIDLLRAQESWELRRVLVSLRAEKADKRGYLEELAKLAFWADEKALADAMEGISRQE